MSGGAWVPEPELAEIPFCRDSVSVDSVPGSCVLVEETLEEPEESEAEKGTDVQHSLFEISGSVIQAGRNIVEMSVGRRCSFEQKPVVLEAVGAELSGGHFFIANKFQIHVSLTYHQMKRRIKPVQSGDGHEQQLIPDILFAVMA